MSAAYSHALPYAYCALLIARAQLMFYAAMHARSSIDIRAAARSGVRQTRRVNDVTMMMR